MRIISQCDSIDVPYERCILWVKNNSNTILCSPAGEAKDVMVVAKYSTKEKTEKALRKMRKQYMEERGNTYFIFPSEDEV